MMMMTLWLESSSPWHQKLHYCNVVTSILRNTLYSGCGLGRSAYILQRADFAPKHFWNRFWCILTAIKSLVLANGRVYLEGNPWVVPPSPPQKKKSYQYCANPRGWRQVGVGSKPSTNFPVACHCCYGAAAVGGRLEWSIQQVRQWHCLECSRVTPASEFSRQNTQIFVAATFPTTSITRAGCHDAGKMFAFMSYTEVSEITSKAHA